MKNLPIVVAFSLVAGCGSNAVQDSWESAGAKTGWYSGDDKGFSVDPDKPSAEAIPGFWGYKEFDFGQLGALRIPPEPFGLHFGGSELNDSHLEQIKRFSGAEYLGLNGTQISDDGLTHLTAFSNINTLDLGYANVTDAGIVHLSAASNLRTLILLATKVTDACADTLCRIESLEILDVSDTAMTDDGIQKLASMPNLRYLGLSDTRATQEGIASIKEQYKSLEVVE